jgi:hypothetical protein
LCQSALKIGVRQSIRLFPAINRGWYAWQYASVSQEDAAHASALSFAGKVPHDTSSIKGYRAVPGLPS